MTPFIKPLLESELAQLRSIDRREEIFEKYVWQADGLMVVADYHADASFSEAEIEEIIRRQGCLLREGGSVIGAYVDNSLIGVVSVEKKRRGLEGEYCKMDILYMSKPYRGRKIGKQLVDESKKQALLFGAKKLYISATPTKNTIDFYLSLGARMVERVDPELWLMEPEDIHLEISL